MKTLIVTILIAVGLVVGFAVEVQAGTVAYWRFEEGTGTNTADEEGLMDATITSSALWTTGGIGTPAVTSNYALDFDTANYVNAGKFPATGAGSWRDDWGNHHTFEFSMYYPGTAGLVGNTYVAGFGDELYEDSWYIITDQGARGWYMVISDRRSVGGKGDTVQTIYLSEAQAAGDLTPNTWVDIAFVMKSLDQAGTKAYIDGVDVTGESYHEFYKNGSTYGRSDQMRDFYIGARSHSGGAAIGKSDYILDEVRLSSGEVASVDLIANTVPEPAALALLALGAVSFIVRRR